MKKNLLLSFFFTLIAISAFSQTYKVGTQSELKKILLEEFTGIHCVYCPQGHAAARALLDFQQHHAYSVAIHCGAFAFPASDEPDFRLGGYADSIMTTHQITSFPSGIINRKNFFPNERNSAILSRNEWARYGQKIHQDTAPVNLYIESSVNATTRVLTIDVEGYFTKDMSTTPYLNIYLTESYLKGPQSGGGIGSDYIHHHMLKCMVTEGWGDSIALHSQGKYFKKQYTYPLPQKVNGVNVNFENLEVITFVTHSPKGEIANVVGSIPSFPNYTNELKAEISSKPYFMPAKYAQNYFKIYVKNFSNEEITQLDFDVTINGETETAIWNGNIQALGHEWISLNVEEYLVKTANNYKIQLKKINEKSFVGNTINGSFGGPIKATSEVLFRFKPDSYASDNTIVIKNRKGEIIESFDDFSNMVEYMGSATLSFGEIYSFELLDKCGDGVSGGSLKIYNSDESLIYQNLQITYGGDMIPINTINTANTSENRKKIAKVYYSKTQGDCILELPYQSSYSIYNSVGQQLYVSGIYAENSQLILPTLQKGVYIIRIDAKNQFDTLKIIIN